MPCVALSTGIKCKIFTTSSLEIFLVADIAYFVHGFSPNLQFIGLVVWTLEGTIGELDAIV